MLNRWLENEPKETLVCAVTSAISLVLSITGVLKGILPFDIAWIAIALCGIPILVGAFKGVIFLCARISPISVVRTFGFCARIGKRGVAFFDEKVILKDILAIGTGRVRGLGLM